MSNLSDLVHSYLRNTDFYTYVKNGLTIQASPLHPTYSLTTQDFVDVNIQLEQIIKGNHAILRSQPMSVVAEFQEQQVLVVIYGEIEIEDIIYRKGAFYRPHLMKTADSIFQFQQQEKQQVIKKRLANVQQKFEVQINYLKASTLVAINANILINRLKHLKSTIYKSLLISTLIPTNKMQITKSNIKQLANSMTIHAQFQKYSYLERRVGFYILFQGIYQICYDGVPVREVENMFWELKEANSKQFTIRLKCVKGRYGFIEKNIMEEIVSERAAEVLQNIWRDKEELKRVKCELADEKDEKDEKRGKNATRRKRSKKEQNLNRTQQLRKSRIGLLQKCSTTMTTARSLTNFSRKKGLSLSNRSNRKESVQSYEPNIEKYQQKSMEKLKRMKKYEEMKSASRLQRGEYWLNSDQLHRMSQNTYFKINQQLPKFQAQILKTYKRIAHANSTSYIKRPILFRQY